MTEKRFRWLMAGLAFGACVAALLVRPRETTLQRMARKADDSKAFLVRAGAEARDSMGQLIDRGKAGIERANNAVSAAVEAGKTAIAQRG